MHPYLTKLGVPEPVQTCFGSFFTTDPSGNILFSFGDDYEHYGLGFHRVPRSSGLWIAGERRAGLRRDTIIGHSAMELLAFLSCRYHAWAQLEQLVLVATGAGLEAEQIRYIRDQLPSRSYTLVFGRDLFGHLADLKSAAGLRGWPVELMIADKAYLEVLFRGQHYRFLQERFSLNVFEQKSRCRFGMRTYKSLTAISFLAQLTSVNLNSI